MKKAIGASLLVAWLWLKEAVDLLYKALVIFVIGLLFGGGAIIGADMALRIAKALAGVE